MDHENHDLKAARNTTLGEIGQWHYRLGLPIARVERPRAAYRMPVFDN